MKTVEQRTQEIEEKIPSAIIKDTPANVQSIMDCTLTISISIIPLNYLGGGRSNSQLKWGKMSIAIYRNGRDEIAKNLTNFTWNCHLSRTAN